MIDMSVEICGVQLKNPIIAASGTCGFGKEFAKIYPLSELGGISLKGTTLEPRQGNPAIRIAETPMGMLNCVGLQNPGIRVLKEEYLPWLAEQNTVIIANIAGNTVDDYCRMAQGLAETCVELLEMNISCPNVKCGGVQFGTNPKTIQEITTQVKKHAKQPLIVKLSPNVTSIKECALAAQEGGADAISLINTVTGMAIDVYTRKPVLSNVVGGLSGPCIKPIAVRMIYEVRSVTKLPIIGMGGVMSGVDAAELMLAGANAVMVGTANLSNAMACPQIVRELSEYACGQGITKISELTGALL